MKKSRWRYEKLRSIVDGCPRAEVIKTPEYKLSILFMAQLSKRRRAPRPFLYFIRMEGEGWCLCEIPTEDHLEAKKRAKKLVKRYQHQVKERLIP